VLVIDGVWVVDFEISGLCVKVLLPESEGLELVDRVHDCDRDGVSEIVVSLEKVLLFENVFDAICEMVMVTDLVKAAERETVTDPCWDRVSLRVFVLVRDTSWELLRLTLRDTDSDIESAEDIVVDFDIGKESLSDRVEVMGYERDFVVVRMSVDDKDEDFDSDFVRDGLRDAEGERVVDSESDVLFVC